MADNVRRGNVVKKEDLSVTAVPFQFQDVQALAKQILQKANQQSQRIIDAARKQAEDIEQSAFDDGKDKGYKEGLELGRKEGYASGDRAARDEVTESSQTLGGMLETLIEELAGERLVLRNNAEVDLLSLALAIAEKVVRRSIQIDPEIIIANVEAVIGLTVSWRDIALHVNPLDYDAVEEFLPTVHERFSDLGRVSLVRSDKVDRGGVRAITPEGEVDLRIAEQMLALERALLGEGSTVVAASKEIVQDLPGSESTDAGIDAIRNAAAELQSEVAEPVPAPAPPDAMANETANGDPEATLVDANDDGDREDSSVIPPQDGSVPAESSGAEVASAAQTAEQELQTEESTTASAEQAEEGTAEEYDGTQARGETPSPEEDESSNPPDNKAS